MLQGKEPSYRTVMALLRCTEPWNAHYAGSSGGSSSEAAVQSEVGRLAQGRGAGGRTGAPKRRRSWLLLCSMQANALLRSSGAWRG